jgi:hypothetical protein
MVDHQHALKSCCTSHRIKHRACTIIQLHRNPTLPFNSLTHIHSGHTTTHNAHIVEASQHLVLAQRASCTWDIHSSSYTQRPRPRIHMHVTRIAQSHDLEWFHSASKHFCSTKAQSEVAHHKSHHLQHKFSKIARTSLQLTLHHHHSYHSTHKSSQSLSLHHYRVT